MWGAKGDIFYATWTKCNIQEKKSYWRYCCAFGLKRFNIACRVFSCKLIGSLSRGYVIEMSARIMITLPDVKGPSAVFYRNSLKIASNAWTKATLCPRVAVPANRSLVFFISKWVACKRSIVTEYSHTLTFTIFNFSYCFYVFTNSSPGLSKEYNLWNTTLKVSSFKQTKHKIRTWRESWQSCR